MHPVDTLHIAFNPQQMVILNLAMAFLMFSVALDVRLADFRKVVEFPRSVLTGLVAQYLLFPLLTLAIIAVFQPPVSIALGMVLVSMCPSGNMTNFLVHFSRSNVALSVTLNAIIILSATVVTPAGFLFWSQFIPESAALRKSFQIDFSDMALIILELIVLPITSLINGLIAGPTTFSLTISGSASAQNLSKAAASSATTSGCLAATLIFSL